MFSYRITLKFYALSIYLYTKHIYTYILKANNLFFVTVGNDSAKIEKQKQKKNTKKREKRENATENK